MAAHQLPARRADADHDATAAERVARVVGGVIRQALEDARKRALVIADADTPEGRLLSGWARGVLDADRVIGIRRQPRDASADADETSSAAGAEGTRAKALEVTRQYDALVAHPANKTALLLGGEFPPAPLLPLGDLYASQVERLAGAWTGPARVHELAGRAGGIEALDAALRELLDRRSFDAAGVPGDVAAAINAALHANRFARRRAGLIPKLSARTIGIDLFA
jgi:hypothetical protein